MTTLKSLQKPKILNVEGSIIRIQHPDISNYPKTYLAAQIAAAGTAMTVLDNEDFEDNDYFIVGDIGHEKTEMNDVNGAVTRGTALTVTNTLKFAHEIDAPVTKIYERKITIYGASAVSGSLTAIVATGSAIDITWNKPFTEYALKSTDTAYSYYVVKFYDGTTESVASDYVISTGNASNSAYNMIQTALDITGAEPDDTEITWEFLIRCVQDWQDYVTQWVDPSTGVKKDWSWEFIEDVTSLTAVTYEDKYALSGLTYDMKYPNTKQSILNIRFGKSKVDYIAPDELDDLREGKVRSQVNGTTSAASVTLVVDDTSMFEDDGTLYCSGQTLTYTSKSDTTDTFSGVPASGTGAITAEIADNSAVWQEDFSGLPLRWTVYNGDLTFDRPPSSDYSGYPIKVRYIKSLTAISEVSDTTEIPFYNACQYYIAYKIEMKRRNFEIANDFKSKSDQIINMNAMGDKSLVTQTYSYLNMGEQEGYTDWSSDITYY